ALDFFADGRHPCLLSCRSRRRSRSRSTGSGLTLREHSGIVVALRPGKGYNEADRKTRKPKDNSPADHSHSLLFRKHYTVEMERGRRMPDHILSRLFSPAIPDPPNPRSMMVLERACKPNPVLATMGRKRRPFI